jgi:hypothetical protein
MRLRYGFNEVDNWWHFALGPQREQIGARFHELDTRVIRIFVFEKPTPDPLAEWGQFAAYVQAVLNTGAVPMVTFAKFRPPYDDGGAVREFAGRCAEVVGRCVERWGGEAVRGWYWCVGDEPNSDRSGGGLTFDHYRRIYEKTARAIVGRLGPFLGGQKPLLGGPAIDGFQPFWLDWAWRFVNEIDNALIGFVSWHLYGDWREHGVWGAPPDAAVFAALLLSRTREYDARARVIARFLKGRDIRNVCGELNAHSHHETAVSGRYNQTIFGAAYYASALLHLVRGGADLELFCAGTDDTGPYGLMDKAAGPTPAFHAKKLFTQYIRYGDRVSFPVAPQANAAVQIVTAQGEARRSLLLVHVKDEAASYAVPGLTGYRTLLKIDRGTGNRVVSTTFEGTVPFEGYGVAVVTSHV